MARFLDTLSASVQLTSEEVAVLTQAGVTSLEDLHSLTVAFPSIAHAGVRVPLLSSLAARHLAASYAPGVSAAGAGRPPSFGAVHPPRAHWNLHTVVQAPGAGPLPAQATAAGGNASIDLRQGINWPIRDQGQRGTCVAFASTACVELAQTGAGAVPQDLSEQFLYWAIKTGTADPRPNQDGTYLEFARDALTQLGICSEADWPYVPAAILGNVSQGGNGMPSQTVSMHAAANRPVVVSYQQFAAPGTGAAAVLQALQNGRPVAVTLPVFSDPQAPAGNNWTTPVGWAYGRVLNPPANSAATGGHAVCIIGYDPDPNEPLGGYFVFRNSWDSIWATQAPSPGNSYSPAPGYGDLSATYVDTYIWEMLEL